MKIVIGNTYGIPIFLENNFSSSRKEAVEIINIFKHERSYDGSHKIEPETTTYFRHKKSFLRNTYQNWHSKTVFIFYEHVNDLEMMDRLFIKYHAFTFHARTQIALLVESQTTYCELLKISSTNSLRTSMGRVVIPVEKHERRGILVYSTWNRDKTRRHALRMRLKIRRSPTFLEAKTYKHPFWKLWEIIIIIIKLQTRSRRCGVDRNGQPTLFYKSCPSYEVINNVI